MHSEEDTITVQWFGFHARMYRTNYTPPLRRCITCFGKGRIHSRPCPDCEGSGYQREKVKHG